MKMYLRLGLVGVAVLVSAVMVASASPATIPVACKLVTPAQVKSIVGYAVKATSGEDTTSCNFVSTAGFDNATQLPNYSTVQIYLYPASKKPATGGAPVSIPGSKAWISSGLKGGYVMSVVKKSTSFELNVFGGKKSPTKAQVVALAKLFASKLT